MKAADLLLIAALAGAIGASAAAFWQPGGAAETAQIRVAGGDPQTVLLDRAQTLHIAGSRGTSVLRVERGRLRFTDSPCRNRVCIHRGWLSTAGDGTACLPNRVSVTLKGLGGAAVDTVHQ